MDLRKYTFRYYLYTEGLGEGGMLENRQVLLHRSAVVIAIGVALAGAALAGNTLAAEVTRDAYREAVEPICKENTEANERIFRGVRTEVRSGELNKAALRFEKAATALERAVKQLKQVPQPSADGVRLKKWLGFVSGEVSLFDQVAGKLRDRERRAAARLVVRLTTQANRANAVVIPFEFNYCRLEPSRFS
ncbi:MAG: hypothetical protein ACJ76D_05210 [Solirubrobacterales bacterium]